MSSQSGEDFALQLHHFFQQTDHSESQSTKNILLNPGDVCPTCGHGKIEYDGMLNLVCSDCGQTTHDSGGACT